MNEITPNNVPPSDPRVKFTYSKSSYFRVIKVDGAWGGISPSGDIVMSTYNERAPIPDVQEFNITAEGKLNLVTQETTSQGIMREVEVAMSMRPEAALAMANWLLDKVRQIEKLTGEHIKDLSKPNNSETEK